MLPASLSTVQNRLISLEDARDNTLTDEEYVEMRGSVLSVLVSAQDQHLFLIRLYVFVLIACVVSLVISVISGSVPLAIASGFPAIFVLLFLFSTIRSRVSEARVTAGERIEAVEELFSAGLITQEELQVLRQRILSAGG